MSSAWKKVSWLTLCLHIRQTVDFWTHRAKPASETERSGKVSPHCEVNIIKGDTMTSKQRAYLKGLAMTMDPIFQVGKSSVTPEFTKAVDEALTAR